MADKPPLSNYKKKGEKHQSQRKSDRQKFSARERDLKNARQRTEKDHLLESISLTTPDFSFILDFQQKKIKSLLSSKEGKHLEGKSAILGAKKNFLSFVVKEDLNRFWNDLESFSPQNEKDFGETEVRFQKEKEKVSYFNIRFSPYRQNEQGQVVEWFCQARDLSSRKEKLEELKEKELKLQLALDSSTMGSWRYDFRSRKVELDDRSCSLLGINSSEFSGDVAQIFTRIHPEDQKEILSAVNRIIKRKGRFKLDFRIIQANSRGANHLSVLGDFISHEQEEISIITGVCIDISEEKQTEIRVKNNEAFLEELQRIAKIGFFDWDLELDILNLSSEIYSILGVSAESPLSLATFYEKVHSQDRQEVENTLMASIKGGTGFSKDFRYTSPTGEKKVLWAQGQVRMDSNKRTTRLLGTIQDISEKKEKEKELKTQNLIIRSILQNLPVIIQIIEKSGTIKNLLGETGLRRIGMKENQTVGENIFKQETETARHIPKVLNGETVNFTEEFFFNGRTLHFLSYYFYDPERELAIGFSIDISAQKQTEAAFQMVSAKNRELERINRVMDMFVYATAHDLKNPINNLGMLSILLQEASSEQEQNEYLQALSKSVQRLKQTILGLTEIIHIESLKELNSSSLKFKEILNHVVADLDPLLKEKKGRVITSFEEESIKYNEAFLTSIVKNLLSNAIKYSHPKRPPRITLKTEKRNGYILLSVSDNGIGIDLRQIQPNLFKPFKRFTSQAEGSGIGLHLIKSMIERNGGYIEVESTPDIGTRFNCFLVPYGKENGK